MSSRREKGKYTLSGTRKCCRTRFNDFGKLKAIDLEDGTLGL